MILAKRLLVGLGLGCTVLGVGCAREGAPRTKIEAVSSKCNVPEVLKQVARVKETLSSDIRAREALSLAYLIQANQVGRECAQVRELTAGDYVERK